jgi:uncharacterized membrane protein
MKIHLHVSKAPPCRRGARRCRSILLASLACAALFAASQSVAQSRIGRDFANPAQDAAPATPQTNTALANPVEAEISAPVPNAEEASSASPAADPFLSLAQDGGQSSSSQSSSSTGGPAKPPAAKTKPPHHGLGIALAVVGSVALAVGITAYALGGGDFCGNVKYGGCQEARDAGLVLMPVGAGVAITGFYLQFHR